MPDGATPALHYVEYNCDTCGERLVGLPREVAGGFQTLRCPECYATRPTSKALVLERLVDYDINTRRC